MLKQAWTAIRVLLILTVVLGVAYPLAITGIGQVAFNAQANGSLIRVDGEVVGSALIGQSFTDADGDPLPEWFQSRPSAAGAGYDGGASSGSNYGPENEDLIAAIEARRAVIEQLDGTSDIPADALTASASGLDPHISARVRAAAGRPRRRRERAGCVGRAGARGVYDPRAGPRLPR